MNRHFVGGKQDDKYVKHVERFLEVTQTPLFQTPILPKKFINAQPPQIIKVEI
jgi:hypothetical protein